MHSYFGASLLHPDDVAPPGPLPQSRALDGNPNDVWLPLISGRTRFAGLPPILTDFRKVSFCLSQRVPALAFAQTLAGLSKLRSEGHIPTCLHGESWTRR